MGDTESLDVCRESPQYKIMIKNCTHKKGNKQQKTAKNGNNGEKLCNFRNGVKNGDKQWKNVKNCNNKENQENVDK